MNNLVFADVNKTIAELSEIIAPPKRLTVPEAANQYVELNTPGGYVGRFKSELVHYLIEPAECLTNRDYEAVVFVGPAQSAKTQMLIDNWAAHTIACDPTDFMIVQTAQDTARDYSQRRIDRLIENSPEIKKRLKSGSDADNTYDKQFKSGMILSLGWPTKNQLAGKAIPKMALTDYDRMPLDIGGEGSAFGLSKKRTQTFMSRGKTLAESSPSQPLVESDRKPTCKHESPPTKGILGLFNTGDRRRAYGQCPHCNEYFMPQPGVEQIWYPADTDVETACASAKLICSANGCQIEQEHEIAFKESLVWLKSGEEINASGEISGEPVISKTASFWLPGWFAKFQSWASIVREYLLAEQQYELSGDEEPLKKTVNTDQCAPYIPKKQLQKSDAEKLKEQAENLPKRQVVEGVRYLTAHIDVQAYGFVVLVLGWGENKEIWVVDWYTLKVSEREDEFGEPYPLNPASYQEDWEVIIDKVIKRRYPLADDSGRYMSIKKTICDSGGAAEEKGKPGVTDKAYEFWKSLKEKDLEARLLLTKGSSYKNSPRVKITYPDSTGRADRLANAAGEVPVLSINTNILKSEVMGSLNRTHSGGGKVHFPDWLPSSFYKGLLVETLTSTGWKNLKRKPNEPFDLMTYGLALYYQLEMHKVNWDKPETLAPWQRPWDENNMIIDGDETVILSRKPPSRRRQKRRRRG